jgi:hypothetical protein
MRGGKMKLSTGKIFVITSIIMIVFIMITAARHSKNKYIEHSPRGTQTEFASGDTNEEVIKTFAKELSDVRDENEKLLTKMQMLQSSPQSIDSDAMERLQNQIKKNQRLINTLNNNRQQGVTTQEGVAQDYAIETNVMSNAIHTIDDISLDPTVEGGLAQHLSRPSKSLNAQNTKNQEDAIEPYYSIPPGTNAVHTMLLTALLGEVPNNGSFQQPPFPFQAIIGRTDLLAANGKKLPSEVGGMKISGYAIGVGSFLDNLSCARAYITQAVYIFNDGHFSVVGKQQDSKDQVNPSGTLGYLSDPWGNTCIPGKYITNAPQVLTALTATGVVSGFGSAIADAQTTTYTSSEAAGSVISGDTAKYSLGTGLSYGMNKASDWMLDRLKGSFDIVYIPASQNNQPTQVVANFTQTIPIDLDPKGRKLRYEHTSLYQSKATDLD